MSHLHAKRAAAEPKGLAHSRATQWPWKRMQQRCEESLVRRRQQCRNASQANGSRHRPPTEWKHPRMVWNLCNMKRRNIGKRWQTVAPNPVGSVAQPAAHA